MNSPTVVVGRNAKGLLLTGQRVDHWSSSPSDDAEVFLRTEHPDGSANFWRIRQGHVSDHLTSQHGSAATTSNLFRTMATREAWRPLFGTANVSVGTELTATSETGPVAATVTDIVVVNARQNSQEEARVLRKFGHVSPVVNKYFEGLLLDRSVRSLPQLPPAPTDFSSSFLLRPSPGPRPVRVASLAGIDSGRMTYPVAKMSDTPFERVPPPAPPSVSEYDHVEYLLLLRTVSGNVYRIDGDGVVSDGRGTLGVGVLSTDSQIVIGEPLKFSRGSTSPIIEAVAVTISPDYWAVSLPADLETTDIVEKYNAFGADKAPSDSNNFGL